MCEQQALRAMKTSYDQSTDSLYVEPRPLPSSRTIEIEEDETPPSVKKAKE
jgi:hypothetical protein